MVAMPDQPCYSAETKELAARVARLLEENRRLKAQLDQARAEKKEATATAFDSNVGGSS